MTINTIQDLENALLFDFDDVLDRVMNKPSVRKEIIELNQSEQLSEGIDAKDQKIRTISASEQGLGNVYSTFTIRERKKSGLQTNNVDLRDSGQFWTTFKVVKVSEGWEVIADYNIHGEDIEENFDRKFDFLGLTNDNLEFFVFDTLLPELEREIRKELKI